MSHFLKHVPIEKRKFIRAANPTLAYYSEYHAKAVQQLVDEMIEHPDKLWTFHPETHGKTVNSLYFYLLRSIMYLVDFLDTKDGKYKKWRDGVMLRRNYSENTVIIINKKYQHPGATSSNVIAEVENAPDKSFTNIKVNNVGFDWKGALNDWVENGPAGTMFECEGLVLTKDDLDYIVSSVVGLNFIAIKELNRNCIKIAKV